jgi:hypothetical protein
MSYFSKIKFQTQILGHFETLCKWKSIAPFLKTHIEDFSLLTLEKILFMDRH